MNWISELLGPGKQLMDEVHDFASYEPEPGDSPETARARKHVAQCLDLFWFGDCKDNPLKPRSWE